MLTVIAALLFGISAQQAVEAEAVPATQTAKPAEGEAEPARKPKRKMVCETVQEIGTRIGGRRVCYDPAERRETEDAVRRSMNRTH